MTTPNTTPPATPPDAAKAPPEKAQPPPEQLKAPAAGPALRCRSALHAVVQAAAVRYTRATRRTSVIYDVQGGFEARAADAAAPRGTHRLRDRGPTTGDGTNGIAPGVVVPLDGTITVADVEREDRIAGGKPAAKPPAKA